ncbi:hypothetical protein Y032_0330g2703 [Ancylostoma ceylanicum]|uniref:ShKT domain-containing protein n=1 Tax=Ancylostoma ceylanicum TaxID=53326 RepID=A0A016RZD4_9BILA|nr:hypothetical protein Y032_0330g2703 [Ancylostoma ceylanicum]
MQFSNVSMILAILSIVTSNVSKACQPLYSGMVCADMIGGCLAYSERGYCNTEYIVREYCKKSCGLC